MALIHAPNPTEAVHSPPGQLECTVTSEHRTVTNFAGPRACFFWDTEYQELKLRQELLRAQKEKALSAKDDQLSLITKTMWLKKKERENRLLKVDP